MRTIILIVIVLVFSAISIFQLKQTKNSPEKETRPFWTNYYRIIGFFIGLIMGALILGCIQHLLLPNFTSSTVPSKTLMIGDDVVYLCFIILCVWATPKLMLKLREKTK